MAPWSGSVGRTGPTDTMPTARRVLDSKTSRFNEKEKNGIIPATVKIHVYSWPRHTGLQPTVRVNEDVVDRIADLKVVDDVGAVFVEVTDRAGAREQIKNCRHGQAVAAVRRDALF